MGNRIYNMQDCVDFGKIGEKEIFDFLMARPKVQGIVDVRRAPALRTCDVDFLLINADDKTFRVEVKTDSYKSGNLFIEENSCVEKNTAGCVMKTSADYLAYYFVNERVVYFIQMNGFLPWYIANRERFRSVTVKNDTPGWKPYSAAGRLVPRKVLEAECAPFVKTKTLPMSKETSDVLHC